MRSPVRTRTFVFIALGAALGAGSGLAADRFLPTGPLTRGLFVGERQAPEHDAAGWLARRRDEARARVVHLRYGDRTFDATLGEAGVSIDVDATLAAAAKVGHYGSVVRRLGEAARARKHAVDVPLVWTVEEGRARAFLARFAADVHADPVDARIDLAAHAKIPDVPGRELDIEASLHELSMGTHEDEETIDLVTRAIPAKVSVDDLVRVDVDKVVSSAETTFSIFGVGVGRSHNIRRAASMIDGLVIAPGEQLSFNEKVGPRSLENGFTWAPEIQGDEMTTGIGGGTCQVSTTLHVAALFGALGIVQRQGHSHPSAYTKMGLDATVSYPTTDLKIANTLPFPVMIHASFPKPTVIRVELLGGDPVATASYTYGIGHTEDFTRRIYVKSFLTPGKRIRKQKGTRGYDVTSILKLEYFDGHVEEKRYFTGYRPSPEVFWIAPGYDEAELPPLPEHAKGVEGRMSASAESAADDTYAM